MARFTLPFTASRLQITTYLFGVALFSISFLVFLNSSVSFVISDLIGQRHDVGDAVGTLGFADELVALVACAGWGVLSDRVGVRAVAVTGYAIVGVSLFLFVQAKNVYPQLLLARLLFSLGGAATSTMVTAILPTMTHIDLISRSSAEDEPRRSETSPRRDGTNGHAVTPSISSELTITPARYQSRSPSRQQSLGADAKKKGQRENSASTSQLAGLVGTFTGLGALLALGVFLPLPARFAKNGVSAGDAVADSYYVVGAVALAVPYPPIEASTRGHLKGSIAGVYSLAGGAGILLLTKLGGYLFDATSPGAPFVMLAVFNAILLLIGLGVGVATEIATRRRHTESF
ncbi:hypothetical protein LTR39_000774 [Cryomyces antarcticus]|nr:hypothetical protein LTR39_000774 [Cryomyces antarcticus]